METNGQTPARWRSQAIKLGLGVIFTNPVRAAGGWSQGLCLDHAVWHSILTLTFGESTTLHSTGLLQCEGNTRDRISQVTEMSATSGLSQQGRFGWIKSTHSTHTASNARAGWRTAARPRFACCCGPGEGLLLWEGLIVGGKICMAGC